MKTGTVKWFDDKKGYGFISCPELKADIFVHFSVIASKGHRTLRENDQVEFTYEEHNGKLRAKSARKI